MRIFGGDDYNKSDFRINFREPIIEGGNNNLVINFLNEYCISFGLGNISKNKIPYEKMQLLLSWHFDIFDLIDRGLAVDVNTINADSQRIGAIRCGRFSSESPIRSTKVEFKINV